MKTLSIVAAVIMAAVPTLAIHAQMVTRGPGAKNDNFQTLLDPQPLVAPELGLTMHLPREAMVTREKLQNRPTLAIRDGAGQSRTALEGQWTLRISALESTLPDPSPAAQIEDHLAFLRVSQVPYTEIAKEPFITDAGITGQICYVEQVSKDNHRFISAWLMLPRSPDNPASILVVNIITLSDQLSHVRPLLETSFKTITLTDPAVIAKSQREELLESDRFLASLDKTTLRRIVLDRPTDQWMRIYQVEQDGSQREIGYSRIQFREAPIKEVHSGDTLTPQTRLEQQSPEDGLLVVVQARVIDDANRHIYTDMQASYWMAWDQSEEAWSTIATRRQGEASQSSSETGARLATTGEAPVLTVIMADANTRQRTPHEWRVPPKGYMSNALSWVIGPALMLKSGDTERSLTTYAYNPTSSDGTPRISKRYDTWQRSGREYWTLTTKTGSDAEEHTTVYDRNGNVIRRTRPSGVVSEPIDPTRLRALWERQGLRTGRR